MGGTMVVIGVLALMVLIFFVRAYAAREAKVFRLQRLTELGLVAERSAQLGNRGKAELYAEAAYEFHRQVYTWAWTAIGDQLDQKEFLAALASVYSDVKARLAALGLDEATIARNRAAEAELERVPRGEAPSAQPHPPPSDHECPTCKNRTVAINPKPPAFFGTCPDCGWQVHSGPQRCPGCGKTVVFTAPPSRKMATCPHCSHSMKVEPRA